MKIKLTNLQVNAFLEDYSSKSETILLEQGSKEVDDLILSAKKRGILNVDKSSDLKVLKTIYAYGGVANANGAILPSKEFKRVLPQIVGKPMNIGHNRKLIVGFYIDYKYILKENKAITYSIFFAGCYPEEWEHAKELHKQGKLSSSFEIWAPEEKRKYNEDGSYELHDMEIAGGALIFEENGEQPAFKDAKVLSMAKTSAPLSCMGDTCLVYAKKYSEMKEQDLIKSEMYNCECISCGYKTVSPNHCQSLKCPKCGAQMRRVERPGPGQSNTNIKCGNCGEEFDYFSQSEVGMGQIKCPKCKSILDQNGKVLYGPQNIDFDLFCPACRVNNWLITSEKENSKTIKCNNCGKEYAIEFKQHKDSFLEKTFNVMREGTVICPQCNNNVSYATTSLANVREFKCKFCGLIFSQDITKISKKTIAKINELKKPVVKKENQKDGTKIKNLSSKQGGNGMIKVSKFHRYINAKNLKDIKKQIAAKEYEGLENSNVLDFSVRENLPDEAFAVVVRVKNGTKFDKIRKYPIDSKENAILALSKLQNKEVRETLEGMGVSSEKAINKVLEIVEGKKWTVKFINSLPDSSFAVVEPDYKNGKTKNKNARHLPFKDANGKVDVPHLRNALVRVNQLKPVTKSISKEALIKKATAVLEKYRKLLKTVKASKFNSKFLRKAVAQRKELEKKLSEKINLLKAGIKKTAANLIEVKNQALISARKNELGEKAKDWEDKDFLDNKKFESAKKKILEEAKKKVNDVVSTPDADLESAKAYQEKLDEMTYTPKKTIMGYEVE